MRTTSPTNTPTLEERVARLESWAEEIQNPEHIILAIEKCRQEFKETMSHLVAEIPKRHPLS